MRASSRIPLALVLVVASMSSGCVVGPAELGPEIEALAWELRPLRLEPEKELSVGRAALGLASFAARHADDPEAEFVAELIDEVSRVHVGMYTLRGPRESAPRTFGEDALEMLDDLGWRPLVRVRHRGEGQWILARELRHEQIEMLIVGLGGRELTVVRLEGNLGGILDHAVRRDADLVAMARRTSDDF